MSKKHVIKNLVPHVLNVSDRESHCLYGFWLGYEWWIRWRKL